MALLSLGLLRFRSVILFIARLIIRLLFWIRTLSLSGVEVLLQIRLLVSLLFLLMHLGPLELQGAATTDGGIIVRSHSADGFETLQEMLVAQA